ncbi:MAG: hypothetical protein KGI78_01120 [Patescibacteria group bacterium]|nr:hypothetical protein [Patescibacteria group bacterium]MDE1944623.1 hypothetical protein [Patescibacteria group bacterium]MDE1944915.1 hypothetical protein [Patescibacteria group bacterium]MDE2057436.1 hypothetical protein [Patescibacteria group bacterium]
MRLRPALLAALPLLFAVAPVAAHATGVPFLGPIVNLPTDDNGVQCAANLNALIQIANNLVSFSVTLLLLFVAPAMIVWAGFLYVFSPTNPAMRKQANTILKDTAIGIGFALAAWLIVDLLLTSLNTVTLSGAKGGVQSFTAELFSTSGSGPCLRVAVSGNFNSSNPTVSSGTASNGVALLTGAQACGGADKVDNASEPNTSGPAVVCSDGSTKCLYPNATPDNGCALPDGVTLESYAGINGATPTLTSNGNGCDPNMISQAAANAGYSITSGQASALACISQPEDGCGSGRVTNYSWGNGSSAAGAYQILLQSHSNCYNNSVCESAVGATGPLNCASGFSGGNPIPGSAVVNTCLQAVSNVQCAAAAAACLVQSNPSMSDWSSAADNNCKAKYNN